MSPFINKYWQQTFFFFSAIFIFATFFQLGNFSWLLKIIPILILIYISTQLLERSKYKWFFLGLIFSLIGDFVLDYFAAAGFIFGLAAFFIAHVFYIIYFGRWQWNSQNSAIAFTVVVYGSIVMWFLLPNLGALFYPVIAYMLILTLMAFSAFFSNKTNYWFVLGGISFVISDSILGLNKFYVPFEASHSLIMLSYYFAQYALVKGCLKIK
ncbi:MAG: lysoplasmalogenase [Kangiellaceae bacterium]